MILLSTIYTGFSVEVQDKDRKIRCSREAVETTLYVEVGNIESSSKVHVIIENFVELSKVHGILSSRSEVTQVVKDLFDIDFRFRFYY